MIHFVMEPSPIISSHLQPLVRHLAGRGIPHDTVQMDDLLRQGEVFAGDTYVSCNLFFDDWLDDRRSRIFQVQLQHNLTGIKGSPLGQSRADLTVLAGEQVRDVQCIDPADDRWVIAGYPKWDIIRAARGSRDACRAAIADELGLDPAFPWVVFYPTGKNRDYAPVASRAMDLRARALEGMGPCEFVFVNHAENEARYVDWLGKMGRDEGGIHTVDGKDSLKHLRACDLFVTDIASTVVTAISFGVPVLFTRVRPPFGWKRLIETIQVGPFIEDVRDVGDYVRGHSTPPGQRDLFERCIAFDDDRNCERITDLILERSGVSTG